MRLILLALLLLGSPAWGAVALDAVSTGNGVLGSTSITDSITIGSISNGLLVCGATGQSSTVSLSSATLGAQSMDVSLTPLTNSAAPLKTWIIFLKAPNSGAGTVTVNWDETITSTLSCRSLSGVDQTTPLGTASSTKDEVGTSTTSTLTLSLPSNGAIFDVINTRSSDGNVHVTGNNVEGSQADNGNGSHNISTSTNLIDGTSSWAWDNPEYSSQLAVPINAATATRRPIGAMIFQ